MHDLYTNFVTNVLYSEALAKVNARLKEGK